MRITILATGSRGDVEPYVAWGKGFAEAGHVLRLVTHADFEVLVASNGLEYWRVEGRVQEIAEGMAALLERDDFRAIMARWAGRQGGARDNLPRRGAACKGADRIVAGVAGIFMGAVDRGEALHPTDAGILIPYTPTSAYPELHRAPFRRQTSDR